MSVISSTVSVFISYIKLKYIKIMFTSFITKRIPRLNVGVKSSNQSDPSV